MSKKKPDITILINYQDWVAQMWDGSGLKDYDLHDLYIMSTGLGGEAGEVLEILKKSERAQKKPDLQHLTEELGDVLYYVTMLCNCYDIDLADVMQANVDKINVRYAHLATKKKTK
jgi:NTP pyrophosphatase (non-canonical NTP hydrolase)